MSEIRPFRVDIPQAELDDVAGRLAHTRWTDELPEAGSAYGVPLAQVKQWADHWQHRFDWRALEARLNAYPQFTTEIDGQQIHFLHVRAPQPSGTALILTHGWPGSVIEQLKFVGPLTDPTSYGADAGDAFDLVIPSLPGHGFSGKPDRPGWDPIRIARAWAELMRRLGYERYVAQGGDWGNAVTEQLALLTP